jgi:spectinomycin phosphotransferase
MHEKPDLQGQLIISRLQGEYGMQIDQLTFLPLGADGNTAVLRAVSEYEAAYFLKLREGEFDKITVSIPQFLISRGLRSIIAPLETRAGRLWTGLKKLHDDPLPVY